MIEKEIEDLLARYMGGQARVFSTRFYQGEIASIQYHPTDLIEYSPRYKKESTKEEKYLTLEFTWLGRYIGNDRWVNIPQLIPPYEAQEEYSKVKGGFWAADRIRSSLGPLACDLRVTYGSFRDNGLGDTVVRGSDGRGGSPKIAHLFPITDRRLTVDRLEEPATSDPIPTRFQIKRTKDTGEIIDKTHGYHRWEEEILWKGIDPNKYIETMHWSEGHYSPWYSEFVATERSYWEALVDGKWVKLDGDPRG
jgi:hypothetical protein